MSGMAPDIDWGWSASNRVEALERKVESLIRELMTLKVRVEALENYSRDFDSDCANPPGDPL